MGLLHHSNYLTYFEVGRTELFRTQGGNYRKMEELGLFFVVVRIDVQFKSPARYDEVLTLRTSIVRQTPAKLEHHYELSRGNQLLSQANTVIACVNADGIVQRIPEDIIQKTSDQ
ncbi:MAG TPA: acyl-CoA thioesterase [Planctomycetes bacterium]|nr:acyl-CoA thioesterase [Fuerstiella sp.]HIK93886.1 acyl-CoA thioesterase [Planctomycetota bacterium]